MVVKFPFFLLAVKAATKNLVINLAGCLMGRQVNILQSERTK